MTIGTRPYFFGHLDHLHKFRQWVKSAMFQPRSRRIPWDYIMGFRPNHHVFHGSNLSFDQFESFIFRKKLSSQITQEILLITDAPHLTIQTSFSSSYSHRTPSLMTGATLTTFLHPAMHGTFPFGDAGTNWWKFSATKSAPSAS